MKTEHTPGPWIVTPTSNPARVWITQDAPPNTKAVPFVAQCAEGNPQAEANARLIAAAPELLAALIDVMSDPYFAKASTRYTHARAAIAKATGGTQ